MTSYIYLHLKMRLQENVTCACSFRPQGLRFENDVTIFNWITFLNHMRVNINDVIDQLTSGNELMRVNMRVTINDVTYNLHLEMSLWGLLLMTSQINLHLEKKMQNHLHIFVIQNRRRQKRLNLTPVVVVVEMTNDYCCCCCCCCCCCTLETHKSRYLLPLNAAEKK